MFHIPQYLSQSLGKQHIQSEVVRVRLILLKGRQGKAMSTGLCSRYFELYGKELRKAMAGNYPVIF